MTDKKTYWPDRSGFLHVLDVKQAMDMVASEFEMRSIQAEEYDLEAKQAGQAGDKLDLEIQADLCRQDAAHCARTHQALHQRFLSLTDGWAAGLREKALVYRGATDEGPPAYFPPPTQD